MYESARDEEMTKNQKISLVSIHEAAELKIDQQKQETTSEKFAPCMEWLEIPHRHDKSMRYALSQMHADILV